MNNLTILIINDILVLLLSLFLTYLISYFKEKGKNLATKEDIQKITDEVEKVKSFYEEGRIKLEKELDSKIEIMKSKLKTTEIYLKKQLEALEEFLKIYREIYPQYDKPDKEWEDACLEAATNLDEISNNLEKFLLKYEVYLPYKTVELLEKIIWECVDNSYYVTEDYQNPDSLIYTIGDRILKLLQESKKSIIREIKKNILF